MQSGNESEIDEGASLQKSYSSPYEWPGDVYNCKTPVKVSIMAALLKDVASCSPAKIQIWCSPCSVECVQIAGQRSSNGHG